MAIGEIVVGEAIKGTLMTVFYLFVGVIVLAVAIVFRKKLKEKRSYNIPVTIIIPRSDNKTKEIIRGTGGYFKSQEVGGITSFRLKRKGVGVIDIPPPASRFLMGLNRELFLIQKGMDDFEPVLVDSWSYVNTETSSGVSKKIAVVNLKCVNQDATAWKFDNEANAKKRFTFNSFWEKYKDFIQITIFILIVFIASYIQYNGLKEVATQLEAVARVLAPAISNAPVVT